VSESHSSARDASGVTLTAYQTLLDVSRMLLGSASLEELLSRVTSELRRIVPYDVLSVYELDEVRGLLVPLHCVDRYADQILATPLNTGEGLTGWVVDNLEAANLPAGQPDDRLQLVPGTQWEPEALVVVPLVSNDRPVGALNVYRLGQAQRFDEHEFELIQEFANLAALALDNAQIRERLVREAHTDWLTGLHNHRHFHERLREEVERAHRHRRRLSLLVFDLDDFKLLNDVHGHQEGDLVLRRLAAAAVEEVRSTDVACRVGGEEFAIVLPETGRRQAKAIANRLCERARHLLGPRPVTISCGIATFPSDAKNPTELLATADAALYGAKDAGKNQAVAYSQRVGEARRDGADRHGVAQEQESLTQIRLLGALASKLNRLNQVDQIGDTIVTELRTMVDYHNARVYLLADDGVTLEPIAFGGILTEYAGETFDALRTRVGEGVTGTAASRGRTLNIANALDCEFAEDVEGTAEIEESMLAVPLRHEQRTLGVIVLSKLGVDQFSMLSQRLMELLAAQAAVALANARLLEEERRAKVVLDALLGIATLAASDPSPRVVAQHIVNTVRDLVGASSAQLVELGDAAKAAILAHSGPASEAAAGIAAAQRTLPADGEAVTAPVDLSLVEDPPHPAPVVVIARLNRRLLTVQVAEPTPRVLQTVTAVAGHAAVALRNAELLQQLGVDRVTA